MSAKALSKALYYMPKPTRWSKGIGAELPEAYKKFWKEWKLQEPAAVHYIKQEGSYVRDDKTEQVYPVQNVRIPLKYPKELNEGIWGGEAIVQGFVKRKGKYSLRTPHFWFPVLKRSVVYSEVLDMYIKVVITNRTLNLIHEHYGFDHYILKTPACDLRSELALKIKRQILVALADETLYPNDPAKREEIYSKYKEYLTAYTREEIEWYGLTYKDACKKFLAQYHEVNKVKPLKIQYRSELIAKLEQSATDKVDDESVPTLQKRESSWISKLNPFAKSS